MRARIKYTETWTFEWLLGSNVVHSTYQQPRWEICLGTFRFILLFIDSEQMIFYVLDVVHVQQKAVQLNVEETVRTRAHTPRTVNTIEIVRFL